MYKPNDSRPRRQTTRTASCRPRPWRVFHHITPAFLLSPMPHASCPVPRPGGSTSLVSMMPIPRFCHAPLCSAPDAHTTPGILQQPRGNREEPGTRQPREPSTCDCVTPRSLSHHPFVRFSLPPPPLPSCSLSACMPALPLPALSQVSPLQGLKFDLNRLLLLKHLGPEFASIRPTKPLTTLAVLVTRFVRLSVSSASPVPVASSGK
jgi:hypothetical protein